MVNKVRSYILKHNMLSKGDRVIVGVSGGADSICLLYVLLELASEYNLKLHVIHINHGIRGDEAALDQEFVRGLCQRHNIDFKYVKKDVPAIVREQGISEEEAGRNVRYEAFHDFAKEMGYNKIAVAHNKNDDAETFLFNLFRGSGITGLRGIPPTRESIIRPLLCLDRIEIEQYLEEHKVPYVIDSTNLEDDYSRNKIRNKILTYAKDEINTGVIEHITNSASMLAEIDTFIKKSVDKVFSEIVVKNKKGKEYSVNVETLDKYDIVIQKELARKIIHKLSKKLRDIDSSHIQSILGLKEKQVGKEVHLPYDIIAIKGYNDIILKRKLDKTPKNIKIEPVELKIPGRNFMVQSDRIIETKVKEYKRDMEIPKEGYTKWFDYDKINNIILLRTRQKGDFIKVDSRGSTKKINSLFIDEKIPREDRDSIPLIADGSQIIWVIGGRISEDYKINEDTKTILEIKIHGGKRNGK